MAPPSVPIWHRHVIPLRGQGRGNTGTPTVVAEILNDEADRQQGEEQEEIRIRSWEKEQPDQAELAWREAHDEVLAEPSFRALPQGTLERLVRSRYRVAVLKRIGASARAGTAQDRAPASSTTREPAKSAFVTRLVVLPCSTHHRSRCPSSLP